MQYTNAISLQGYLEKESPTIIKIFQKRYFTYRNKGEFLVWFKKKPNKVDDQPKGTIYNRKELSKYNKFHQLRLMKMNPELSQSNMEKGILFQELYQCQQSQDNKETRDKWAKSIDIAMNHLKKTIKSKNKATIKNDEIVTTWKWGEMNGDIEQLVRMQNQTLILNEGDDNSLQDSSNKKLQTILLNSNVFQIQKNIIYGFLNKKSFISSQIKWYLLCSQFNLYDEQDDIINQKVKPMLAQIQKRKVQQQKPNKPKKNNQSDSSSSHESQFQQQKQKKLGINILYQYDSKTMTIKQQLQFVNITGWSQNISETPYSITINYVVPKNPQKNTNQDYEEEQKQMILMSNYMIQIKKWNKAIQIVYDRYSIKKSRELLQGERFQKYQVKMLKINDQEEWRILGTNNKAQYLYLNNELFKVSGFTYKLDQIYGPIKYLKLHVVYKNKDEQISKETSVTIINLFENQKIQIVFENAQIVKLFKKKIKKILKNIQIKLQKNQERQFNLPIEQQIDPNTYFIDKKVKQTTNSIKVNFYEMMDRDVSAMRQQKPPKSQSFWDRFIGLFCGPPKDDDLFF